jgi:hypothetical protein
MTLHPEERNMIAHRVINTGTAARPEWTVVFHYPNAIRTFDGRQWTAQEGRWRIDNDNTVFIHKDQERNLFTK